MFTANSLGFASVSCYVAQADFERTVSPGWPTSFCFSLHTMLSSVVCVAACLDI